MQTAVLEGVLEIGSIERLSLDLIRGSHKITALLSRIIHTNRVIRTLRISSLWRPPPGLYSVYDCWVLPLVENDTLEEVGLPLDVLCSETWSAFFHALPAKENLKMVHIFPPHHDPWLNWLCAELERSGSEEKVSLGLLTLWEEAIEVLDCKAFSGVDLSSAEYDCMLATLVRLPNCLHLKNVDISIETDEMTLCLAMAEFLRSTSTLEVLELCVNSVLMHLADQSPGWNVILESLSQNRSLRRLDVSIYPMCNQAVQGLAESVKQNTHIRRIYLQYMPASNEIAFLRCLSRDVENNYRLTEVDCSYLLDDCFSDYLAVKATTWRNSGLVARAAQIKQASHLDRYVSRAVDRVSRYPALLDEVARSAKLDQAELAVLVRDCLSQVRSLHGFMRVAGVVKERVICHPTDDGRTQLDDLNEDCWSHVRRYLATDDIEYGV
ncbi:hypothetical protein HPB51_017241 [Rhipicephalus microplus]|uniref:Uncharacterized protein n=1 Tax=Rhipicephalus microplus TaxID=6941 RepID=A0A9J6EBM1_RHIMP|nr:hypothetical protein HPB51_017241 [Rhipicephalus microplus]